uniref:Selenoprotein T n=1 Tax=Haptolina brevifila TaxID=156173 RepID=A0A7S2H207_9EUKA|mmetsp:Transcript_50336/g.100237  ORF Transcript_50336/g.100237 Transcript_50336/m.100237 type:complete len:126 (+) Transcript_50336:338-715(+)
MAFPDLKIEGGPYTPPASVQYAIRSVRVAQVSIVAAFFFGEQLFASLHRPAPAILGQMQENKFITAGAVYGLDVIAQTFKSINAFELTYNGQVLHSKLSSGKFPDVGELVAKLKSVMEKETKLEK